VLLTFGLFGLLWAPNDSADQGESDDAASISSAAAERCRIKLIRLEDFVTLEKPGGKQTTRFSDEEVNSYLAQDLSSEYHPSLKSIETAFEKNTLQVVATVDFDRLGIESTRLLSKMANLLFSGTHKITARGKLQSGNGEAYFELEKALFDNTALPNFLVESILTAVGKKQDPPFDPMQPGEMPYKIDKVDVHPGYIIVYQ
jgi:hypothetical protein